MKKAFDLVRIAIYALVFIALIFLPLSFIEERSFCIYYNLFHIRCFGCGTTRAVANLLRFDLARALSYNRYAVMLFPVMFFIMANDIYCVVRRYLPNVGKSYTKISLLERLLGIKTT